MSKPHATTPNPMSNEAKDPELPIVHLCEGETNYHVSVPDSKMGYVTHDVDVTELVQSAIKDYIKPHLEYCREHNGLAHCKNCGLEEPK